jgi:hypothetical protein
VTQAFSMLALTDAPKPVLWRCARCQLVTVVITLCVMGSSDFLSDPSIFSAVLPRLAGLAPTAVGIAGDVSA